MIMNADDTKNSQEKDSVWETWEIKQTQPMWKRIYGIIKTSFLKERKE